MKEVLQWHMLYDVMLQEIAQYRPPVRDRKCSWYDHCS